MDSDARHRDGAGSPARSREDGPAHRDADAAARRAELDEADADRLRHELAAGRLPILDADGRIAPLLGPGEQLHDLRSSAILRGPGSDDRLGFGGTLYLTSDRLVHLGQVAMSVRLLDIQETSLSAERLLISLRDGEGLSVDISGPRAFRALLAAAIRAVRP